jgi:hypothetical protein
VAGLIITVGEAAGESVGTACLSEASGEVYALAPYRSVPSEQCHTGDQTVRLSLHQPDTAFAKRNASVDPDSWVEMARLEQDLLIALRSGEHSREGGNCELVVDDLEHATEFVIASVPAGEWQEGLGEIVYIDHESAGPDGESLVETFHVNRLILTDRGAALVFHDVFVDHRGSKCFGAFFVEAAQNPGQLYGK